MTARSLGMNTLALTNQRTPPAIREVPRPAVDVGRTCAAIDKARAVLGYDPSVGIGDGLAQFKEWYEVTYGHQRSSVA